MPDDDELDRDFNGVTFPASGPPYAEMIRTLQRVVAVIDRIADLLEQDR